MDRFSLYTQKYNEDKVYLKLQLNFIQTKILPSE